MRRSVLSHSHIAHWLWSPVSIPWQWGSSILFLYHSRPLWADVSLCPFHPTHTQAHMALCRFRRRYSHTCGVRVHFSPRSRGRSLTLSRSALFCLFPFCRFQYSFSRSKWTNVRKNNPCADVALIVCVRYGKGRKHCRPRATARAVASARAGAADRIRTGWCVCARPGPLGRIFTLFLASPTDRQLLCWSVPLSRSVPRYGRSVLREIYLYPSRQGTRRKDSQTRSDERWWFLLVVVRVPMMIRTDRNERKEYYCKVKGFIVKWFKVLI